MAQKAAAYPTNDQPRDFVGYGPNPPYMTWPGGVKVAVNLVLNYEEGSEYSWTEDGRNDNWGEYNIPVSPPVAPDPQTRITSDPVSRLSPTAGISSTTRFSRVASATSGPSSTPAITPG